jgi:glycosyltransferase involved in cell wall biosynthesis
MDKIIVPSNHSKNVFEQTVYKAQNQQTGEEVDFKVTTPVEVCAFPAVVAQHVIPEIEFKTDFNFLSVAQWGFRKNVEATITNFLKEFKDDEDVGLVLKLNVAKNSTMDKEMTSNRLQKLIDETKKDLGDVKCAVYLLHGSLTDDEMRGLYRHPQIKAFVTTTHGEGFGLPMFEAAIADLPIAAPSWSSYVDFLYAPKKDKKTGKTKKQGSFYKD